MNKKFNASTKLRQVWQTSFIREKPGDNVLRAGFRRNDVELNAGSVAKLEIDQPLVSIVTPSYNQGRFLEATIQSVLAQDYPRLEYIIVDGGSQDGSQEIIKRYADRLAWWISEPDSGQTDAINKGFSHAKGEIFAWLNSDDTYQPGAVREAVTYLQSHPEVGMVYGDANLIDDDGLVIGKFPASQTDYRRLRQGYVHIPQQAAFFRADLWRQVGPLDPTFYFAMDYDLWVRLARLAPINYNPRSWANFRLHGDAKSVAADDRCWPEMLRVHYREGGNRISWITFKAAIRPLIYAWLPVRTRMWLRRILIGMIIIALTKFIQPFWAVRGW